LAALPASKSASRHSTAASACRATLSKKAAETAPGEEMAERTFHAGRKNGNKLWKMPGCWGGGNNGLSWQVFARLNNQTQNTT